MQPVTIQIVAYAPTEFFHCSHCEFIWQQTGMGHKIHAEQRATALPPDLAAEYARIGEWAAQLVSEHGTQVDLQVIDGASLQGFFTTLRFRLGRLPAIIVDRRQVFPATDLEGVTAAVRERVGAALAPGGG